MQAVLKVVGGKNDGRQITISVPEFVIGRGDKAHLKPSSELVSRMHCAIRLKDGKVEVEDLGSRNGSFINDQQLTGPYQAKSGDRLRIGTLNFEILIDPTQAGNKKPRVKDVADAAARTVESKKDAKKEDFDDSISDWLAEPDDSPLTDATTVQFSMDDLESILDYSARQKESIEELKQDSDSLSSDWPAFNLSCVPTISKRESLTFQACVSSTSGSRTPSLPTTAPSAFSLTVVLSKLIPVGASLT